MSSDPKDTGEKQYSFGRPEQLIAWRDARTEDAVWHSAIALGTVPRDAQLEVETYLPLHSIRDRLISDEACTAAMLAFEGELPYMARVSDFTDEEIAEGKLKATDEKANRENRAAFREAIEAALAATFPAEEEQDRGGQ